MAMQIELIPVLSDNYAYLLIDSTNHVAAAVDPVDAEKVYSRAKELQLVISLILTTHSHWDHAGGNRNLVDLIHERENRQIPVLGGPGHAVEAQTQAMADGDDALFTGDTLFVAGCGRFFSGIPAEMHHALNEVVAKLPQETKIYCGHEYTVSNLRFAAHVEPDNEVVQKKLAWAIEKTKSGEPTVPSTTPVKVMRLMRAAKDNFVIGK
ncbi:unnamed protein product [Peronospora destructor]|uniref:hydroxyacylglutathione hydrolase n=1 Tax=Peronospora destructor TaxID=86335 RepID=A0AAV0SVM8_9STRA|nr:unnamed protein product [Peronospora destructor]